MDSGTKLAGLLALAAALTGPGCAPPAPPIPRPNLLLITLDTTRPDRLGLYGYARDTSPNLDRLAQDSVVYTEARSTTSWTLPAHASLFTGRFPSSHGALLDPEGPLILGTGIKGPESFLKFRARGLGAGERTLAEILGEAGYASGAVVAGPWMKRLFGLDRGFDFYDDNEITELDGRHAASVTDSALAWIAEHRDTPFFLFLNYYDPHAPYTDPEGLADELRPPPATQTTHEMHSANYDAEIRYMDRHLGRLFAGLAEAGVDDQTWIIITADHGESLGEHERWGHGHFLFEVELRIPLLMRYPKGEAAAGRSSVPIQLTDVLPLVLHRLDLPVPPEVQGADPPAGRPLFAEVYPLPRQARPSWRAWIDGRRKFLWNSHSNHLLFDLDVDPEETRNLAYLDVQATAEFDAAVEAFVAELPAPTEAGEPREVDSETQRALRNLGYLE